MTHTDALAQKLEERRQAEERELRDLGQALIARLDELRRARIMVDGHPSDEQGGRELRIAVERIEEALLWAMAALGK